MLEEPSNAEVRQVIDGLLSGEMTREAASNWACRCLDKVWDQTDPVVDDALSTLAVIAEKDFDGEKSWYLFDFVDITTIRDLL
jgi:hypothetical protein